MNLNKVKLNLLMNKYLSNMFVEITTIFLFICVTVIIILNMHYKHVERVAVLQLNETNMYMRMDSLEKRIITFETLYRDHLENCSFISNDMIRVGHDNYLQLIKEDGTVRN